MRILVCISCVPDTTSKISFIDSKKFDSNGVQYIIGPYEDYGLARAVELKEKDKSIRSETLSEIKKNIIDEFVIEDNEEKSVNSSE